MNDTTTMYIVEALSIIKMIHKKSDILLEKDISKNDWESVQKVVEIIRYLQKVVERQPYQLTSTHWDFVFIGLYGWAESAKKTLIRNNTNLLILQMVTSVCDLFIAVTKFMDIIKSDVAAGEKYKKLSEEWSEVVFVEVCLGIFNIFKHIVENINDTNYNNFIVVLNHLCACSPYIKVLATEERVKIRTIARDLIQLLQSNYPAQQIASAILLQDVVCPLLVEFDSNSISDVLCKENQQLSIVLFKIVLDKTQLIVETIGEMVEDLKLGEHSCQVQPFTEAFTYTSSYLLAWSVLLKMLMKASSNLRFQYTEWIKDNDFVKILMPNILRLMPEKILDSSAQPISTLIQMFNEPNLKTVEFQTSEWIECFACSTFSGILSVAPALVRQWWTSSESRLARIVEHITSTYVSSQLCNKELQDLSKLTTEHMQVRVHSGAREVVATYTVDETRMEIVVTLPNNYPLGTVKIDCHNQIGATNQWRNSIMQLSLFLTHQNGNVMDGLNLWKNNLDKHFDGVEECYICFSVIHAGTYQLPKLSCQKCKKKFHSACLYKWFSTSNKSTCPICRSLF